MKFRITRILNNSIAIVDRGGNDVIVYSKGIAHKANVGAFIDSEMVEKTYVLDSHDMLEHFSYLLTKSNAETIDLVNNIVDHGESILNQKANDYLRLTLLDHVNFAVKRAEKKQYLRSPLTWEVKKFYPEQFKIGLYAISQMNEHFQLEFPEDEAVSIALHFVNLQEGKSNLDSALQMMDTLKTVIQIIEHHYRTKIDESSLNYMRLLTHLQYFVQRLESGEVYNDNDQSLNQQIKKMYKDAYQCVQKIRIYINETFHSEITIDEETYLMLHIQRVTNRAERND